MLRPRCLLAALLFFANQVALADEKSGSYPPPAEVRTRLLAQLDRPRVPLDPQVRLVEPTGQGLVIERLSIASERKASGQLERVPILIVRPEDASQRRPLVIVLHGTGGNKEREKDWLVRLARTGFIGLAIDARYHGERSGGAQGSHAYVDAITAAWRAKPGEPQEHPFYFDTVWDLWRVLDYVSQRPDVDPRQIAMVGFSMGGIQTWLAAAVDQRVQVAIPAISVQSFRWSLEHDRWQGRANTILAAHREAARDLGEPEVNQRVCRVLWNKLIPGMLDDFDCPSMIRLFAGRPLLVVSGELDPNCPLDGARLAFSAAESAYQDSGTRDRLKIDVAPEVAHKVTSQQEKLILEWLVRWLHVPPASSAGADNQPDAPRFNPRLAASMRACIVQFEQIPESRKSDLKRIAAFVRDQLDAGRPAKLVFICTHNSRRSQMSQIWASDAASYYQIADVACYSGGTEQTAFNPRAVAALERAGMKIEKTGDDKNPRYLVQGAEGLAPLECFSKKYSEAPNPKADFCAVMTCSEADKSCAVVAGAAMRISIPFEDPKVADGTSQEASRYDERCAQIAREMLYLFSQVRPGRRAAQ